ncbi:mucin-6-like [Macrobrachium nipponense]|uniref:mucin-6-like n=1 Tax=Macrobrachium nipponense TaxID=159736 RepID=UPI0030C8B619
MDEGRQAQQLEAMDSFLGNTRQFFQGVPSSTRGYGVPTSRDDSHAPPTPTPPATPTLPPSHPYHPYPQPMTGAVPATSVPGLLPPSRPMTPVTPSHKPPDHSTSASPYNIPFLHPTGTKPSSADARFLPFEQQYRQAALATGSVVAPSSTRSSDTLHSSRAPSQSHNNGQGLTVESRMSSRTYAKPPSLPVEGRSHMPVYTTQAPSTDLRHPRLYNSTQPLPNDVRVFSHPYSSQNSTDSPMGAAAAPPPPPHSDSKYFPRPEPRPPDPRIPEARDLRADIHQEHWGPYGTPHAKSLERLAPSVHFAETSASVNGSKDARYLGKKPEEVANIGRPENSLFRKSIESLQVNGSRDSLYPNGSHSVHSLDTKRDPSSEMKIDNRPKEDSALDLSVKTVRQTSDSSAPSTEKSHSQSPHITTPLVEKSTKDPQRRTPSSSVPVTSPYSRTPSRDASPSQLSELIKNAPGISGTSRGASPSHSHQYGITGSPRPLQSPSPLARPSHMLPPTKRTGDPPYYDHASKYARLSLNPSSKGLPSTDLVHERSLASAHKESLIDQSRGLPLYVAPSASKELDIRYSGESKIEKRPLHPDARDHGVDWRERRDISSERRDLSISIERKNPVLDIRDSSLERREPPMESKDLIISRKDAAPEGKDSNYDRREISTVEQKYSYGKHPAAIAASVDPYRTWMMPYDHSKYNSVSLDRQKYVPGSQPVPTSVPTSLPHQNSRVPPAQLHSSYRHPSDTRLPQTPYASQASHTAAPAHPPAQGSSAQSTPAKIHQPYIQQSPSNSSSSSSSSSSRTSQIPTTQSSGHPSQSPATTGQLNSATQPHYPYPYNHAVAAHYAQQQQQHHRQPRPPSAYPPFNLPQSTKSSSLPPPALTPQQVHQPYLYPQHRSDPSLSLYPSKRSNQLSPHPSGSPHPSISPHPSASPNTAASPHPAASPHHMIASPRSAVSPHVAQQSRIPQYSPHHTQRPSSASSMQHNYPGSLPPSPYSGPQSHISHTTPPSSRPSSATSQHSLSSQATPVSSQSQRSPYPSPAHSQSLQSPVHPQSSTSHPSQPYSSQSQSPHPSQGPPPPPSHTPQTRVSPPPPPSLPS